MCMLIWLGTILDYRRWAKGGQTTTKQCKQQACHNNKQLQSGSVSSFIAVAVRVYQMCHLCRCMWNFCTTYDQAVAQQ